MTLAGQLSDGDPFGVDGTIGNDQFEYIPAAMPDTGTVVGTMDQNNATGNGPFPLVPVTFTGVSQTSLLRFNTFAQVGGSDSFVGMDRPATTTLPWDRSAPPTCC